MVINTQTERMTTFSNPTAEFETTKAESLFLKLTPLNRGMFNPDDKLKKMIHAFHTASATENTEEKALRTWLEDGLLLEDDEITQVMLAMDCLANPTRNGIEQPIGYTVEEVRTLVKNSQLFPDYDELKKGSFFRRIIDRLFSEY